MLSLLLASVSALTAGAGGCGLQHSQSVRNMEPAPSALSRWFFARFLCRLCPFLYFVTHQHLESRRGKFHQKKKKKCCSLYFLLPFWWQSKAVRDNFSSSPGGEIIPQALSAITSYQNVGSGNSKSILNVSKHGIQTLLQWTPLSWEKNVGMDANLVGLPLKKSTAGGWQAGAELYQFSELENGNYSLYLQCHHVVKVRKHWLHKTSYLQ